MSASSLVPNDNLTPFVYVDFDSSGSSGDSLSSQPFKNLAIGQSLVEGSAPVGIPVKAQTAEQVAERFGEGSMLHHMAIAQMRNDSNTEKYFLSIKADDPETDKGKLKGEIAFSGKATSDGAQSIYIGDRSYRTLVRAGDTPLKICKSLASLINSDSLRYVDSVKLDDKSATLRLVARQSGQAYLSVNISNRFYSDDRDVPGITLKIKQFSGDLPNPEITPEIVKQLGSATQYNIVMTAIDDERNIKALINEWEDRWGPARQIDGHILGCTHVPKQTFQDQKSRRFHTNSKQYSIFYSMGSASPAFKWCSAIGGCISRETQLDPNRQLNEVPIKGLWSPKTEYNINERNDILRGGVSTWKLDAAGTPMIERVVTQYLKSPSGEKDVSYRDYTLKATLSYIRYDLRVAVKKRYPRHKLADDGTRFREGLPIVTPSLMRAFLLTKYKQWQFAGLVEGYEIFKKGLVVERNPKNRDRLDCKIRSDIVNQLRTQNFLLAFLI